jgi:hypothetical protein
MSKRPFVWHSSRFMPNESFRRPWAVTMGRPEDLNDYENSFETLPEAHSYAMGIVSAEQAVSQ